MLLMVLLLVILFSGLGLMAMQHTCTELRTAGAYLDNNQAAAVAEAAIAMVATDMRLYWDYRCNGTTAYYSQFADATLNQLPPYTLQFSPAFDNSTGDNSCPTSAGQVPDGELAGTTDFGSHTTGSRASVTLTHGAPTCAPCPSGFSGGDTYAWYWFTATSQATYGPAQTAAQVIRGTATVDARMMIGPLLAFDTVCRCNQ